MTRHAVQPILPMAALPKLGCVIQWSDVAFTVRHPTLGLLPARLNGTSPELPVAMILRLITEYEQLVARELRDREGRNRLWRVLAEVSPEIGDPQQWLEQHIRDGTVDETILHLWIKTAFPEVPKGADLLSPDIYGMLLQAAILGAVDGLTAGPPCRTMSVLRMRSDGGPRQLRDKFGSGRFGRVGLNPAEQATVDDDSVLFLRTFLLMAVVQAASKVWQKPKPLFFVEQPATPSDYAPESPMHVNCPSLWTWPEAERMCINVGSPPQLSYLRGSSTKVSMR